MTVKPSSAEAGMKKSGPVVDQKLAPVEFKVPVSLFMEQRFFPESPSFIISHLSLGLSVFQDYLLEG